MSPEFRIIFDNGTGMQRYCVRVDVAGALGHAQDGPHVFGDRAVRFAIALLSVLLVSACVRSETTMLTPNTAIIETQGTAFDSHSGVAKGALVEAATQTVSRGYRYFIVLEKNDTTQTHTDYTPGTSQTTGWVNPANGTYSATTTTTPGYTNTWTTPGSAMTIRMFKDGEVDPKLPPVWDAEAILATAGTEK